MTPPLSQPVLEGITRESVMKIARARGFEVAEVRFAREALLDADEVFLTGTAAEVTPVREIDNYTIGAGGRGPITEQLQAAYFDAVNGRDDARGIWLTPYTV
jgi:branched-chain amino acid aminotransferase